MSNLYFSLIALCLLMELASKVDTSNIGKKLALLLIIIGSSLHLANRPNGLIEIGVIGYLLIDVAICFISKNTRNDYG